MSKKIVIFLLLFFLLLPLFGCQREMTVIPWEELMKAIPTEAADLTKDKEEGENFKQNWEWSYARRDFLKEKDGKKDRITISLLDTLSDEALLGEVITTREKNTDIEKNKQIKYRDYAGWQKVKIDDQKGKTTTILLVIKKRVLVRVYATSGITKGELNKTVEGINYRKIEELIDE